MPPPAPARLLAELGRQQDAFASLVELADLQRPVPACAPWTVGELLGHLTGVHRWVLRIVEPGCPGIPAEDDAAPVEPSAYREVAAQLREALSRFEQPCPTLEGFGQVRWWTRRQLHETFIHHLDLSEALGSTAAAPAWVAADCIAEVVDTLAPRQVRLGRMPPIRGGLRLTSPSGTWQLGTTSVAEVRGPDLAIAQLLWRRTTVDDPRLTLLGDKAAATDLLQHPLSP